MIGETIPYSTPPSPKHNTTAILRAINMITPFVWKDDLVQLNNEVHKLKSELQELAVELHSLRQFKDSHAEEASVPVSRSPFCCPEEWTRLELATLASDVFGSYCWENLLSESERDELHQIGIHTCAPCLFTSSHSGSLIQTIQLSSLKDVHLLIVHTSAIAMNGII
jgi:hypothetical protein